MTFTGNDNLEFGKTGRKKATTFTGFCDYHDSKIFSPIENEDYVEENKEQEFLFAYRALAYEHHANKSIIDYYKHIANFID